MTSALCRAGGLLKQAIDCLSGKDGDEWLGILQYALRRQVHPSLQTFKFAWPTLVFDPSDAREWHAFLLRSVSHRADPAFVRSDNAEELVTACGMRKMSYGYLDLASASTVATVDGELAPLLLNLRFRKDKAAGLYLFARLLHGRKLKTGITYCFLCEDSFVLVWDKEGRFWRLLGQKPAFDWMLPAESRVFFCDA